MEKRYLIGLDIGTTTVKAVFLDALEDRVACVQTEEIFPVDTGNIDEIEYDPGEWWEYVKRILKRGFDAGVDPGRVAGVCLGGWTVMALLARGDGTPLTNAIHYNDMRHIGLVEEVKALVGGLAVERNYNHIGMYSSIVKLYWWKKNRPEIFEEADVIASEVTWINHKLTGEWAFSRAEAGFYSAYNADTRQWDDEIIERLGFPRSMFLRLVDPEEAVGYVTKEAAEECGLAEGTPVFGGTDDSSPGAIATSVTQVGQAYINAGSAGNVGANSEKPICHETIICSPHCLPGLMSAITVMSSTGLSYKWMRNTFGQAEAAIASIAGEDAYSYLDAQAKLSGPGARGVIFLPYLDGDYTPNNDTAARGVFIGMDTATTKNDMLRAVMEGVAFCILDNIELIRGLGAELSEGVISGGVAKSPFWLKIIADVTGCTLSLAEETEGAPLGYAVIAGVGAGLFHSFEEAAGRIVKVRRGAFIPDPANHALYKELYRVYKGLYPRLKDTFAEMQDIRERYGL
ncbi:MAG: FGGY family carbohydrate kinase [Clostridiales bacterium]|nr:FGGY family carbohydrate kinase [Clostridiales bacterium]